MISRRCPIVPMLVLVRQSLFSNKVWTRPHPPSVASACRCDLDPPTDNHSRQPFTQMKLFRNVQFLLLYSVPLIIFGFTPSPFLPSECRSGRGALSRRLAKDDGGSVDEQALDALRSLADFHDGQWQGQTKSFQVTADVAAGIVQRRTSPKYKVSVKLGLDVANRDFTLSETMTWDDKVSSRKISLQSSNVDVDAVDGSYSLDQTLPDLPADLMGTTKLPQFLVEHCLAVSDDCRARCWAMYGVDGSLIRVVVGCEERVKQTSAGNDATASSQGLTVADFLEIQSDVDRLVDNITGGSSEDFISMSSTIPEKRLEQLTERTGKSESCNGDIDLTLHSASLLEMSAGVWLGDVIIRDHPTVALSREQRGQGFGTTPKSRSERVSTGFAEWSVGVQKIAWRWMWNFGEEIRQVNDAGKSMGAELVPGLASSLVGTVCVNEGLSRRIPKEDRMVYVDWNGDDVGFLVESFSIQLPRYLTFDRTQNPRGNGRPLSTEFAVFQRAPSAFEGSEDNCDESSLPKLVCSKVTRVYNFEGLLKQGCTSFFTFKRFGTEKDAL